MSTLLWLMMVYFFLSFIPAFIAAYKNRSFLGFLLLSLFTTPLIGLIASLIVSPLRDNVITITTGEINSAQLSEKDKIELLEKLLHLKEKGILSEEELSREKNNLLS